MNGQMSMKQGFRLGRPAQLLLVLAVLLGSVGLTFGVLHQAHAALVEGKLPGATPWGVAFDGAGRTWVAEPACDGNPVCTGSGTNGAIAAVTNGVASAVNFSVPMNNGFSSPMFVRADAIGNVWFSMPLANKIGKLVPNFGNPGASVWTAYSVITASAGPFDLTFDTHGNLWFTEVLANKIGELNPATGVVTETATPSGTSKPYGIAGPDSNTGAIWFTENLPSNAKVGSFMPPASGALTTASINEYPFPQVTSGTTPHLITYDGRGNIWVTGGFDSRVYQLTISALQKGTSNGIKFFTAPLGSSVHISGIGADGNGTIWADDSLGSHVFSLSGGTFNVTALTPNSHPHDGVGVSPSGNVFFTEEFADKIAEVAQSGVPPIPTSTVTPPPGGVTTTPGNAPISKTWYFAEGRVGKGFREYITMENPGPSACSVNLQYLYVLDGSSNPQKKLVTVNVPAASRVTEAIHSDLGIDWTQTPAASLATIVNATNCNGIVAERPEYFVNYHGISSGTDVLGVTHLNTSFYFADVPTSSQMTSYLSILNPNNAQATVTATYFANGHQVGVQNVTVPANARGTLAPNNLSLPTDVAAVVTSTAPVMVERPTYFSNVFGVNGAADVVGSQTLASDWLFAEGFTGSGYQENLSIANLDPKGVPATVQITLKSQSGATNTTTINVPAFSQDVWNVNAANVFTGSTPEVSIEVKSTGGNIVAQRVLFFYYQHTINGNLTQAQGVSDVVGLPGSTTIPSIYSFAEGYSNFGYNEWLTVQDPTATDEVITVTLVNGKGVAINRSYTIKANTRSTLDVSSLVRQFMAQPGDDHRGYEVSMVVQSAGNAPFVAERPEYWNTFGVGAFTTQGGSDIVGYSGG
jgi:streptogramin lyase